MPESTTKKLGSGIVSYEITVDGKPIPNNLTMQEIEVVKEVNKIPYARIVILDGDTREQTFPQSEEKIFEPGWDSYP